MLAVPSRCGPPVTAGATPSKEDSMRLFLLTTAVVLAASNAFAFKPAVEREFDDIASSGCSNRDGDFIVRGMVSNANENTLVLSDALDARSTLSVTLPGRGPFARVKGAFTKGKYEASAERLNELRAARSPVTVTLECKGNGTPLARNISYANSDGTRGSISF
jgi:hypothetical protein